MNSDKKLTDQELEILLHMHKSQFDEANFRRMREIKIFLWSGSLFVAIIGILVAVDNSKDVLWDSFGIIGKIVVSVTIAVFCIFSIIWQNRERKFENEHKRVIAKINKCLFVFEKGCFGLDQEDTLYPNEKRWKYWGDAKIKRIKRFFRGNFITATWVLALLAISMVWLAK